MLSLLARLANNIGMPKLNARVILFVGIGLFVLFVVLVLFGVVPGLKKSSTPPVSGSLLIWATEEGSQGERAAWEELINKFKSGYPAVTVAYKNFDSPTEYENALLEGLATGDGPDVFMVLNRAVPRYANKLFPAKSPLLSLPTVQNLFPKTVEADFAPKGTIYGLPLSIDTLALIYNRSLMDQAAVEVPKSWESFEETVPKLAKSGPSGISLAGAALGASKKNIANAPDILSLLMLQLGTEMVNPGFTSATFNSNEGKRALAFYTQFVSPASSAYTWNESMPDALDLFSQEKVAMMVGYQTTLEELRERNRFLDVGVAEVPSPETQIQNNRRISYPRYYGLVVSRQSKNPDLAWQFVTFATTKESEAGAYMMSAKKPPALRSLLLTNKDDAQIGVFARQALTAVSWPQVDNRLVENLFSNLIERVNRGEVEPAQALEEAAGEITKAMQKKF